MGGGGKVGVAFEKLENVGLHGVRRGPGVGPPQQREQGAAEAGARPHLPLEELKQLPLVHLQQLKGLGHLGGHALAHAGEHHRPLTGEQAGEAFGHGGSGAKPLEEGLEIRVVANGTVALQIAVLPVSPPVGAVDLSQIRRVLNMGVFRRGLGHTVVVQGFIITGHGVGRAQEIGHFFFTSQKKLTAALIFLPFQVDIN